MLFECYLIQYDMHCQHAQVQFLAITVLFNLASLANPPGSFFISSRRNATYRVP